MSTLMKTVAALDTQAGRPDEEAPGQANDALVLDDHVVESKQIQEDSEPASSTSAGRQGSSDALGLPGPGQGVAYYPRPGELRAGKGVHAAIVTAANEDDGSLDLVVVYDADDFIGMRRVPRRTGNEGMGWVAMPGIAALTARVEALEAAVAKLGRQLFGADLTLSDTDSILGIIDEHEDRIEAMERPPKPRVKQVDAKASAKAKRPSGKKGAGRVPEGDAHPG